MQVIDLSADRVPRKKPRLDSLPPRATIISLDPGGTTGWSLMDVNPHALVRPDIKLLDSIQIHQHGQVDCGSTKGNLGTSTHEGVSVTGEAAGVDDLVRLIRAWPAACVLIEDFIVLQQNASRDFLSAVRITSAVSQSLWNQGRTYFVQSSADAKSTATDSRLRRWGLWDQYEGNAFRHARDADRHSITWLRKCMASAELRERCWPHLYAPGRPLGPPKKEEKASSNGSNCGAVDGNGSVNRNGVVNEPRLMTLPRL